MEIIKEEVALNLKQRVTEDKDYNNLAEGLAKTSLTLVRHSKRWFTIRNKDEDVLEVYINRYTSLAKVDVDNITESLNELLSAKKKFTESHGNIWRNRWSKKKR